MRDPASDSRTRGIGLAIAALLCMRGLAPAAPIAIDGDPTDWGVFPAYNASDWIPDAGIAYSVEDSNDGSASGYVGPGYGGQDYDAEAAYLYVDDTYLWGAVISGQRWDNSFSRFGPGDLFITTGSPGLGFVIETTGVYYSMDGSGFTSGTTALGSAGDLYSVSDVTVASGLAGWGGASDPTQIAAISGTSLGTADLAFADYNPASQSPSHWVHSVIEFRVPRSLIDLDACEPVSLHWTMVCGNDAIDVNGTATVPEPATILLTALGLGATALTRRRRSRGGTAA